MKLVGYTNRWSVRRGDTLTFHVHCEIGQYEAVLVRLIHGDTSPRGPGFKEVSVESPLDGTYAGEPRPIRKGSCVVVDEAQWADRLEAFTLECWIWPTAPGQELQGIMTHWSESAGRGFGVFVGSEGKLVLRLGGLGAVLTGEQSLLPREWYFVSAGYDPAAGSAFLYQEPLRFTGAKPEGLRSSKLAAPPQIDAVGAPLLIGASWTDESGFPCDVFNGKIAGPRVFASANPDTRPLGARGGDADQLGDVVADWDFAQEIGSTRVLDRSPHARHGRTLNRPTRGVTGPRWTGTAPGFTQAPAEYDAIHFHDDDMVDANWPVSHAFTVPGDMPSGVYALRLRSDGEEDYLPFFVCPPPGGAEASVALLMPTLSYLAYSNESLDVSEIKQLAPLQDMTLHPAERRYAEENGIKSTYDRHSDGSGICHSSIKRPIMDFRPKARCRTFDAPHQFPADLCIVDWLETKGFRYDIITDHDLHRDGAALLAGYRLVITGSHPEYWTGAMLDARDSYLNSGGRLMYLGGNGFYWVTAIDPGDDSLMEVRRFTGTRTWQAEPGEYQISLTGEMGGLWRDRGRGPQKTVGVAFSGMGFDRGAPYRRLPASSDPDVAFIFEEVNSDVFGDGPALVLNHGAAGFEVDRASAAQGTPSHAKILATSFGLTDAYQLTVEELISTSPWTGGSVNRLLGADMVYLTYPDGGAVFSVGSITWTSTLSFNGYDSDTSRITENVLRAFLRPRIG